MHPHKLLDKIYEFKKNLKEYRRLTEGVVEKWNPSTELKEKLETSEEEEKRYEQIKSEISRKLALFGEGLKEKTTIIHYSSEGKKMREYNGMNYILTIATNLKEERFEIYGLNIPEKAHHKRVWSLVLNGIERYIGELMYFDERKNDLKKKELELKNKEEELQKDKIRVDALSNALEKFMKIVTDPKRGAIEVVRSEYMSKIKENHRKIERNTNPHTKSQNN